MLIPLHEQRKKFGVRPREVLHIGAHLAEEGAAYSRSGVRKVWWVEANPALIPDLLDLAEDMNEKPVGIRPTTHLVIEAAVGDPSDTGTTAALHLANNGQSSSLLKPGTHLTHHPEVKFKGETEVTLTTIDELAIEFLMAPDYLNLDIQGAELAALQGAVDVVLPGARWVYAEVNTEEVYVGCPLLDDLDEFLAEQGFTRLQVRMTKHGWGDALWERKR